MAQTVGTFGIIFNARGNALQYVQRLNREVGALASQINALQSKPFLNVSGAAVGGRRGQQASGGAVGQGGATTNPFRSHVLQSWFGQIGMLMGVAYGWISAGRQFIHMGEAMIGVTAGIAQGMFGIVASTMAVRMEFELLEKRFEFVFGDKGGKVWQQTLDVAMDTLATTKEMATLVQSMGLQNVTDPFTMVRSRTGEMITAAEALADVAAVIGPGGTRQIQMATREFLSGGSHGVRSMMQRLNLPGVMKGELQKIQRLTETDVQAAYQEMAQLLATQYGGLGRAMEGTTAFILGQFPDIYENLADILGKAADEVLNPFLNEVMIWAKEFVRALRAGEYKGLLDGIRMIAEAFKWLGEKIFGALKWIVAFIDQNPHFVKLIITLTALVGVLTALAGVLFIIGGSIFVVVAAVAALTMAVGVLEAALIPILLTLGGIIALMTGAFAAGLVLLGAYFENWGGFADKIEDVFLVLQGLFQLISSEKNTIGLMDHKLASKLEQRGLMDTTLGLFHMYGQGKEFLGGVKEGFMDKQTAAARKTLFEGIIDNVSSTAKNLGKPISAFSAGLDAATPGSMDGPKNFGEMVGWFLGQILNVLLAQLFFLTAMADLASEIFALMMQSPMFNVGRGFGKMMEDPVAGVLDVAKGLIGFQPLSPLGITTAIWEKHQKNLEENRDKGRKTSEEVEMAQGTLREREPGGEVYRLTQMQAVADKLDRMAKALEAQQERVMQLNLELDGDTVFEKMVSLQSLARERGALDAFNSRTGDALEALDDIGGL